MKSRVGYWQLAWPTCTTACWLWGGAK